MVRRWHHANQVAPSQELSPAATLEISVETVDLCLTRLVEAVKAAGGILIVTADHGNADEMYELNKQGEIKRNPDGQARVKTSHTLNPVPCYIYDATGESGMSLARHEGLGISSLAATVMNCLGFTPPADYDPSIITWDS